jgi:hypothetical protein
MHTIILSTLLVITTMMMISVEQVNGFSFTCFLEKSETDCTRNGGLYCLWKPNAGKGGKGKCDLSPFSLTMLCLYDKVDRMCEIAKETCSSYSEKEKCSLQEGVCTWKDNKCVGDDRELTFEDMLTPPPTSEPSEVATPPPSAGSNGSRAECCQLSTSLCSQKKVRSKPDFAEQLQAARRACQFNPYVGLRRICKSAAKRCVSSERL